MSSSLSLSNRCTIPDISQIWGCPLPAKHKFVSLTSHSLGRSCISLPRQRQRQKIQLRQRQRQTKPQTQTAAPCKTQICLSALVVVQTLYLSLGDPTSSYCNASCGLSVSARQPLRHSFLCISLQRQRQRQTQRQRQRQIIAMPAVD